MADTNFYVGVALSLIGNVLVSIALNVQKYSHMKDGQSESHIPYIKRKLWWIGLVLILCGEIGNFLAYGFAPATVVAPLSTIILISNAIIATLILKEKFRIQDGFGVFFAIAGAVIVVVFSAPECPIGEDGHPKCPEFSHDELMEALRELRFIIYMCITLPLIIVFMGLSYKYGKRFLLINMVLVGLFGGYTVISTKAIASLLTVSFAQMFTYYIFYIMIFILIFTGVMQIKYIQKSLEIFDATEVIPMQYTMFTIFAIVAGGILYNDFAHLQTLQFILFFLGIACTFFGVFLISYGRKKLRSTTKKVDEPEDDIEKGSPEVKPFLSHDYTHLPTTEEPMSEEKERRGESIADRMKGVMSQVTGVFDNTENFHELTNKDSEDDIKLSEKGSDEALKPSE